MLLSTERTSPEWLMEALPKGGAGDPILDKDRGPGRKDTAYGWISIGTLSGVSSQTSTISAFDRAMQPSVQSLIS